MKVVNTLIFALITGTASFSALAMTQVEMQTSMGTIRMELDETKAPKTVANFVNYARSGFYSNTIFHRVIDGFMIQGGGFSADMNQKATQAPIENEAANGLKNVTGTIAMARTNDPHSATAQFFINLKDNNFLDYTAPAGRGWGYTVFGKVTQGMDVVQRIAKVETANAGMHQNVPTTPVVIKSVTVTTR